MTILVAAQALPPEATFQLSPRAAQDLHICELKWDPAVLSVADAQGAKAA
jgi:hypothetical protein